MSIGQCQSVNGVEKVKSVHVKQLEGILFRLCQCIQSKSIVYKRSTRRVIEREKRRTEKDDILRGR